MAIPLRTSFSCCGLNCPWEKSLGYRTGEEPIPLLDDENKRVDKPEIDIVTAGDGALARIYGRSDIDSSPAQRDRPLGFCNHMPTERASTVFFEMYAGACSR